MVRKYGQPPYRLVLIHGGPGDRGSLAGLARRLAKRRGVVESIQSKYTVQGLIEELRQQIQDTCTAPVVLIGHSWGAWLAGLFAVSYANWVKKVILIGAGPLVVGYEAELEERRKRNLQGGEREEYEGLLAQIRKGATDVLVTRLGELAQKADCYGKLIEEANSLTVDEKAYPSLWPEAARMRASGELLRHFTNIHAPVVCIQGEADPHPLDGVTQPLAKSPVKLEAYIVKKCGHWPWREEGQAEFYQALEMYLEE